MIEKKSPKGNLDRRRNTFLIIGFIVAIGLIYLCFELFATKEKPTNLGYLVPIEIEFVENTTATDPTPPKPTAPAPPEINIKPVDKEIEIDLELILPRYEEGEAIPEYEPIDIVDEPVAPPPPERFVDENPEPIGGWDAMYNYLKSNLKYPEIARNNGIQGTVNIEFIVEKDGTISDVKVVSALFPELDQEAVRVVKMMPKWKPGIHRGKTVRCYYNIPVRFTIH